MHSSVSLRYDLVCDIEGFQAGVVAPASGDGQRDVALDTEIQRTTRVPVFFYNSEAARAHRFVVGCL